MKIDQLGIGEGVRHRNIRLRALREAPDAFESIYEDQSKWPLETWTRLLETLATFVAVLDGEDVGMVRGAQDEDNPDSKWLISMWVAPKARGRGVGEALINALMQWASSCKAERVLLEVGKHNQPAIALYERMDFVATGQERAQESPRDHIIELEYERKVSLTE